MQIAVARMKHVTDLHAMPSTDIGDGCQDFRQAGAWYDRILDHQRRRDAAHGSEGFLASLPQLRALGVGGRDAHITRALIAAAGTDGFDIVLQSRLQSIYFAQQNRRGVDGIPGSVNRRFDRTNRGVVHHLECCRNDAGGDDTRDGTGGVMQTVEVGEQRANGLR